MIRQLHIQAIVASLLLMLFSGLARAHDFKLGDLVIDHPWSRATAPNARVGGAYLTVVNSGAAPDRLVSASSPVAGKVELHTHIKDGDIMRMREIPAIDVPARGKVELKPGGLHIMLIDLKAPLKQGDKPKLTLVFEKAGAVDVEIAVEAATSPGTGHGGHRH